MVFSNGMLNPKREAPISNCFISYADCKTFILKYILKRWQNSWEQQIYSKLHEIHFLAGKTSCSYSQIRQEPVVLTRCRIGHCRITYSYFIKQWGPTGMYSVSFQLFIETCYNWLRRCCRCSAAILLCQQFV